MFGNQLSLGVTIALRDAFTRPAGQITRGFYSLDDAAYRSARGIRRSLGNIEVGYANVTRTIAAAAAVATVLVAPIKMSAQFSRGLMEVSTIADQTALNLASLRERILDLSGLGQDAFNTTDAVYESVSSGFLKTADAMTVTTEAAKSGVAELTDTKTALSGLVSVLNAYRMSATSASHVSDMLFETIRLGRVRGSELAGTIGTVVPVAAGANMPIEQMLGTYSTMTLSGLNPSQAAQYLRQIITGMQKPAAQSMKTAQRLGLKWGASAVDARHGDVMGMILEAWDRTGRGKDKESFFRLFGGKQSATGLMSLLAKDNGALWKEHVNAHKNTTVFDNFGTPMSSRDRAVQMMMATTTQQAKVLKEETKALAIEFGDAAEGHAYPFVKVLASMVTGIRHLLHNIPGLSKVVYGLGSAFTFALVSFAAMQLWMIRMNPRVRDLLASLNVFSRRIGLITVNSKNVIPTFMGLAGVLGLVAFTLKRLYNEGGAFHDWVNQKVLLVKALSYGITHMNGLFADIPVEMADALKRAGILDQYIYWIRILGRVKLFFDGMFQGIKAGFEMQFTKLRDLGRGVANFLERVGLKKFADNIRKISSGLKIEDSWVGTWLQVGFTVGKVLAAIITIWTITKTWRGAVLAVQGVWWLMTRPAMMLKRVLWDGPVAAFRAMRDIGGTILVQLGRMARMAMFKLFGPNTPFGRPMFSNGGWVGRGSAGFNPGVPLPPSMVAHLQAGNNLGLWNRLVARAHGPSPLGNRAGALWQWAQGVQAANAGRMGSFFQSIPGRAQQFGTWLTRTPAGLGPFPGMWQGIKNRAGLAKLTAGAWLDAARMPSRGAGAGAPFGPSLVGMLGNGMAKLKSTGTSAFSSLTAGVVSFGRGLASVGMFFVANPIGLAILGIVALVGLLIWKWDAVKSAVVNVATWVHNFFTKAPAWVAFMFGPLGLIIRYWDNIKAAGMGAWTKLKEGFTKYVQPVIEWFIKKLSWVTDLLGITSNAFDNSIKNPLADFKLQQNPQGIVMYQSAQGQYARLNNWLNENKAAFEAGSLNQGNERLFRTVYALTKDLGKQLPLIARQNNIATAMVNNPALAALSDKALARLRQVGDDAQAETDDANMEKSGTSAPTTPKATELIPPMARAIEAGAKAGTAKGIQESLSRQQWSGDKWLVKGQSPFAGLEAKYMDRAMERRVTGLTSENYNTEMSELKETVREVTSAVHTLTSKQTAVELYLDGKKLASGLIGHFGQLRHRSAVRGVGGQE